MTTFTQFKSRRRSGRPLSTPSIRFDEVKDQMHFSVAAQREIPDGFIFTLGFHASTKEIYLEKVKEGTPDSFKMPKSGILTVTGFGEDTGFEPLRWSLKQDGAKGWLGEPILQDPEA